MTKKTTKTKGTTKKGKTRTKGKRKTPTRKAPTRKKTPTKKTSGSTTKRTSKAATNRVPRGFEKVPGQEDARGLITERLNDTKERLDAMGIGARVFVHEYKNGEVDGEIAAMVPRGMSAIEASQKLEKAFQTIPGGMGTRFFFAPGIRLGFNQQRDDERSGSARVRGMDDMQMYYRRMTTPKLIDSFLREQKKMIPGAEARYKRKIEIVYLRLNWNPGNKKPER